MTENTKTYEPWLTEVEEALSSVNMSLRDWQTIWSFDFHREFELGTTADDAAMKANRFWWYRQNNAVNQACQKTADCWLPRNHTGECQPYR